MSASPLDDQPIDVVHPLVHPSGVFFGLDESRYHRALALSASGIKWLRVSPLDWWSRSPLNDDPDDEEDSEAKIIGSAYHSRILEGRDTFYARYAAKLDDRDFPDALKTNKDIAAAIVAAGGPIKGFSGKRKDELIEMLLGYDPEAQVWESLLQTHERRHAGKEFLSAKTVRKIEMAAHMIEAHPQLGKAFKGGYSEVSVFWRDPETGVPMKARLDYWKTNAIADLKSFDSRGLPLKTAIAQAMLRYRYFTQACVYLDAAREARTLIDAGLVYGDVSPAFLQSVAAEPTFMFVFSAKGPAPVAKGFVAHRRLTYMEVAKAEVEDTKHIWARNWRVFGEGPWVDLSEIETFADEDFIYRAY